MQPTAPLDADGIVDVAALYADRADHVREIVRREVRTTEPVIEDACQIAWARLVDQRARVTRDSAIAWLATTAIHEAIRTLRRGERWCSLDALLDQFEDLPGIIGTAPSAAELAALRLRLGALRSLPDRQRRLVWLQGLGLSYSEMGAETGDSVRTVERQLGRARRRLAHADDAER
ncbi:MAG TPA: sigma-70 family RNA polymerase sigma factor [Solirubrobacteraceae bacterium]|jgi:RNA polymerase sigma factor (sigma-70 family)|nr:sigma-70 family RNA polymerase sigma factor [Solirubrobacteraceae bacterium]